MSDTQLTSYSRQHNNFIATNNRTTCFDRSLGHLQVLNMLQVCRELCTALYKHVVRLLGAIKLLC